jgi:hypothetical protein
MNLQNPINPMSVINLTGSGNSNKSKCPECGKDEEIIEVCKNCGHKYPEEEVSWKFYVGITILIIISIWLMATMVTWIEATHRRDITLVEYVKDQGIYIKDLSKKLW